MKDTLTSEDFHGKTESEVQRWLAIKQQDLKRRLLQAFITLRGQAQVQGPVIGADGVERTHVRQEASRQLETVFGTVMATHTGHSGRGRSTLCPVDANLNLPATRYSHEVDRQVAIAAARLSFDEALQMVGRPTGAQVPKRRAEQAAQRAARDFEAFYAGTQR